MFFKYGKAKYFSRIKIIVINRRIKESLFVIFCNRTLKSHRDAKYLTTREAQQTERC